MKKLSSGISRGVLRKAPRNGIVTAAYLKSFGACYYEVSKFKNNWPKGLKLTRENLIIAAKLRFRMNWVRLKLLTYEAWKVVGVAFDKAESIMANNDVKRIRKYHLGEISWKKLNQLEEDAETRLRVKQGNILADALGL